MWPFQNKNIQKSWSVFFIILGLFIMIIRPLGDLINALGLNSFVTGLIITFTGFFYFMDVQ